MNKLLNIPFVYKVCQYLFQFGDANYREMLAARVLSGEGESVNIVDVGCGPASLLFNIGLAPIGVDCSHNYIEKYIVKGKGGVVGSADNIPFQDNSFDVVWSSGLLHHLPDQKVRACLREMLRLRRAGGGIIIFDAVLPRSFWRRPFAALIRQLDRGRFMRDQDHLESLLPKTGKWKIKRYTYNRLSRLELLVMSFAEVE